MSGSGEFGRGWPIVLASGVGVALGTSPVPFYEMSLFAPELAKDFGWGIGSVLAGLFFVQLGSVVASPAVGFLADRYGARRVTLASIVCFSVCLSTFSVQTASLPLYYIHWFVMAFTGAGTLPITWTRAINQCFELRKGLAMGLALTGTGVSAFVLKPATAAVIAAYGWRMAFVFLGLLPVLISLPLAFVCFRQPSPSPRSDAPLMPGARPPTSSAGRSFTEALRDWRFWLIGLGILPVAFAIAGPVANMDGILRSHGVDNAVIVRMFPYVGLAVIVGRLCGGWLVDRIWAPAVAVGLFGASSVASWLLVNGPPTASWVLCAVLGVGLAGGLEFDLMAFLTARYFGARHYGGIYGTLYAFFGLGAGIAPLIYGRAFDSTRSFATIVDIGAGAMLTGGILLLFLGPYRYKSEPDHARRSSASGKRR